MLARRMSSSGLMGCDKLLVERRGRTRKGQIHMNFIFKMFAVIAVVFLVAMVPAYGQVETGTIAGTVKDSAGGAVAGANVVIKNVATSAQRTALTGSGGE